MRSQKETYVYVVLELPVAGYAEEEQRFIKIGRTIDIERRLSQFKLCTPREYEVLDLFGPYENRKARNLEINLHKMCCEYRVRGEWFRHEAIDLVSDAMKKDETMNIFEKKEIQNMLQSMLSVAWVLADPDVEVTDSNNHKHVLDLSLHTGEFIYGRITIGQPSRAILPGIKEIQCSSFNDIGRCVELAINMQESHCRSKAVRMVA